MLFKYIRSVENVEVFGNLLAVLRDMKIIKSLSHVLMYHLSVINARHQLDVEKPKSCKSKTELHDIRSP